ncbi:nucleoside hydrolase [Photobacterium sanctipauli]|uniref:Nucleoside hydrolase n=1 Tax=Photobacterium sanctipauli TaxID=1342794 RepID=A0A2T3NX22_9GAMM|nr:nucleoside hydrolase [Photobacterium sanctipauli]PSW20781.1 nucleoside hydrolase [Photobacterium sanctipauli]
MTKPTFPSLTLTQRAALLDVPDTGRVPVVIDSDTFNEIDDQYAIAWAMLNHERIDLQAVYAAPFTNSMFNDTHEAVKEAKVGMDLSYDEIFRVIDKVHVASKPAVFRGATAYLKDLATPERTPAVDDLIERAKNCEGTLQVIAIGAPTNIASALMIEPSLVEKIHVLWLGGHAFDWENTYEYNMLQDIAASRVLLDSGVALTLFPCMGVTNTLATSVPELEHYLLNTSEIGHYLGSESSKCPWIGFGNRKVVWDIAPVGYVLDASWYTSHIVPSPVLNDNFTWSFDHSRHPIRVIKYIERDHLFVDMFKKLIKG